MGALDGISEGVKNFQPDNIFAVLNNPAFIKIWFFIKMFLWMIGVVFICICIYKFILQYKVKITIKTRIGNGGIEVKHDRAKIIVDDQNKKKLQLFKMRKGKMAITCPIPESIYKSKIGKSDHYELWLDDNYQMHPIDVKEKKTLKENIKAVLSPKKIDGSEFLSPVKPPVVDEDKAFMLKIRPQERDAWARFEDKALREKYRKKDTLEKYLPSAILMMAMITAFLIWFFAAKQLGSGLNNLASQFAQVASACTRLGVG